MKDYLTTMALSSIEQLDKTTVDGFAEALCLAMTCLKDSEGRLLNVKFSDDPSEHIRLAIEVAKMMTGEK